MKISNHTRKLLGEELTFKFKNNPVLSFIVLST